MCSGSEQKLIDCPDLMEYGRCAVGTALPVVSVERFAQKCIVNSIQQHVTHRYDCVVAEQLQMVEWRCAEMGSGEQCVMTLGIKMTPVLHADNWDSLTSVSW